MSKTPIKFPIRPLKKGYRLVQLPWKRYAIYYGLERVELVNCKEDVEPYEALSEEEIIDKLFVKYEYE